MQTVNERIEGVVIGVLLGFDSGVPLVVFPGNPRETAVLARSLCALDGSMVGAEVALLFEGGDPGQPLVVGRIVDPARRPPSEDLAVVRDGETVRITAGSRIELRCGKATIILEKDGRIVVRGTYLTSHASASNRIRGGSVNIN
jgi:hypothetical protein